MTSRLLPLLLAFVTLAFATSTPVHATGSGPKTFKGTISAVASDAEGDVTSFKVTEDDGTTTEIDVAKANGNDRTITAAGINGTTILEFEAKRAGAQGNRWELDGGVTVNP